MNISPSKALSRHFSKDIHRAKHVYENMLNIINDQGNVNQSQNEMSLAYVRMTIVKWNVTSAGEDGGSSSLYIMGPLFCVVIVENTLEFPQEMKTSLWSNSLTLGPCTEVTVWMMRWDICTTCSLWHYS